VTLGGVHASSHSAIVAVQRLGKRFISGFACSSKKGLSEVEKDSNYKRLAKFKDSAWKFVYYLTADT
jgi:ceramide synthetase